MPVFARVVSTIDSAVGALTKNEDPIDPIAVRALTATAFPPSQMAIASAQRPKAADLMSCDVDSVGAVWGLAI